MKSVIRIGLLDMQVCVPKETTDEEAEAFANSANPAGGELQWKMKHTGNPTLSGCDERVQCEQCAENVHIMLEC